MQKDLNPQVFVDMQEGKPYKTYAKTILGKVYVEILDPFTQQPYGMLLVGNPRKKEHSCYIDVWSSMEDAFFRRRNRKHLETGVLIQFERDAEATDIRPEFMADASDEKLVEVLAMKYMALVSTLNKITSETTVQRLIDLAKENEKSIKIINTLEARLSELQGHIVE